jgi:Fe-S oxidoreductase
MTGYISQKPSFNQTFYSSLMEIFDGQRIKACLQCGTCSGICPFGYLMDFPPSKMISALRAGYFDRIINNETIWMCVSCYACTQSCPAKIPLTLGLMTRTKEELLLVGNVPVELQDALQNTHRYGNPLGESPRKRALWTRGIEPPVKVLSQTDRPVDVLWFVGDYGSFHPRVQIASRALAKVLNTLGIDFAILGHEENSDGDSQRLAGERGLFELLAEKNSRLFQKYQFNEIITGDPHAFNAFKNEYPKMDISYPVSHYTQYLASRKRELQTHLKNPVSMRVAYHDPCYLGRVNEIYDEPRALLQAIPGIELVEMTHSRENSLCCGGGGGGMWLEGFQWEHARARLSEWRVREAVAAGIDALVVACPYETPRFEDAAKMVQRASRLIVLDIAELLAQSIGE